MQTVELVLGTWRPAWAGARCTEAGCEGRKVADAEAEAEAAEEEEEEEKEEKERKWWQDGACGSQLIDIKGEHIACTRRRINAQDSEQCSDYKEYGRVT